jgi:hypothetical protein
MSFFARIRRLWWGDRRRVGIKSWLRRECFQFSLSLTSESNIISKPSLYAVHNKSLHSISWYITTSCGSAFSPRWDV